MPKFILEEKRLETLRRQLYGKDRSNLDSKPYPKALLKETTSFTVNTLPEVTTQISNQLLTKDISFLRADLFKILTLAILAIGIQLLLYWSLQMKLIHF